MKLNQALTRLKNLKSKVARVETAISESATHYEDEVPAYSYEEELVKRTQLINDIRELKTRIQVTNATTVVDSTGRTLAEVILINADLRSEMAFVTRQLSHSIEEMRYGNARTKDDIKKVFANGCDKVYFQKRLNELEATKEEMEELIGTTNASTDLV